MNKADLYHYIVHPENLSKETLPELQMLLQAYPYFVPAHLLLLKNLKQTNDFHFEEQLAKSSIAIPDRKQLFLFLNNKLSTVSEKQIAEPHLETIEKESISVNIPDKEIKPTPISKETEPTTKIPVAEISKDDKQDPKEKESAEIETVDKHKPQEPVATENKKSLAEQILEKYGKKPIRQQPKKFPVVNPKPPAETEKTSAKDNDIKQSEEKEIIEIPSFTAWLNHDLGTTNTNTEKKKQNSDFDIINRFIEQNPTLKPSSETNDIIEPVAINEDDLFSVTLAKIYTKQKVYDKAIRVYEKLILHYPEKSSYFAAQIEKLKPLINN